MLSFLKTNIVFFIFVLTGSVSSQSEIELPGRLESSQYSAWDRIGALRSDLVNAVKWVSELYQDKHYCPNGDKDSFDAYQGSELVTIYTKMWASGENCDRNAERDTIAGSIWNLFDDNFKSGQNRYQKLPEAGCLIGTYEGSYGGTYMTYLSFGTNRDKVYNQDCVNVAARCNRKGKDLLFIST